MRAKAFYASDDCLTAGKAALPVEGRSLPLWVGKELGEPPGGFAAELEPSFM